MRPVGFGADERGRADVASYMVLCRMGASEILRGREDEDLTRPGKRSTPKEQVRTVDCGSFELELSH